MWSSTLPTGTISNTQRADRTFPRSKQAPESEPPQEPTATSSSDSQQLAAATAEIERLNAERQQLREEIQQLNARVDSLRSELRRQQAAKQAIIDRYEQLIGELQLAAATAGSTGSAGPRMSDAGQKQGDSGLIERLTQWL